MRSQRVAEAGTGEGPAIARARDVGHSHSIVDDPITALGPDDGASLQQRAYDQLRGLIMRGEIAPGRSITIRSAAQALGVSMRPVRAALHRLETEGALIARGGKRVLGIPDISANTYREIREIRLQLEGLAAERAAEHMTAAEVAAARAHAGAMQEAAEAGDRDGYVAANWAFHLSVYRASRMPMLVGMIEALWLRVGPFVATMMPDRDSLVGSMPAHWQVLDAAEARDGRQARRGITRGIKSAGDSLIRELERRADEQAAIAKQGRGGRRRATS